MSITGIHQFVVGFDYGDAISNFALEIRKVLRKMGYESEIYGKYVSPEMRDKAYFYTEYDKKSSPSNVVLFHFSTGSSVTQYVKALPEKKVLIYHNITPAEFFDDFDAYVAKQLRDGRKELLSLRDDVFLSAGVSRYDCRELQECGFKNVQYLPLVVNLEGVEKNYDRAVVEKYRDGMTNILFVGRIAPNKRIENLLKVFYFYKRYLNSASRLIVVGGTGLWNKYYAFLQKIIDVLQLKDVIFTDKIKDPELVGYYKVADVYLSMSEHEGFGLPLLEAMYFGVPVVAYSAAAVPETVRDGGILVEEKDYGKIAETIDRVVKDYELQHYLVEMGKKRLLDFSRDRWERYVVEMVEYIKRVVGGKS